MSYLFLDFDGTTHPLGCRVDLLFCKLDLLEDWLRRHPRVKVVISSSWRLMHPFDEMVSYFAEDLQARIVGVTPSLAASRYTQIQGWQAEHGRKEEAWVALDDQPEEFPRGCPQLVLCNPSTGLTVANLLEADDVLSHEA